MMKKLMTAAAVMAMISAPAFAAGDAEAGKAKSAVCAACHGAEGISQMDIYPNLAGQKAAYIVSQLKAFKNGERNNAIMAPMAMPLSEQDMEDLAAYYASL
ncbi:cytochrome c [Oceanimonas smirnovii]|uniref:Cytochrome c n=2 Tax=Aeromonadaceae TaxID=84642 RepID=A0ABW7P4C7_9GAMM|nr:MULTISPECIES: cytochrome c [Oceanimonas]MDV2856552.1 cytochrome c [Oceanimonas sp. CAM02]